MTIVMRKSSGGGSNGGGNGGGSGDSNRPKKGSFMPIPRQVLLGGDSTTGKPRASHHPSKASVNISSETPSTISQEMLRKISPGTPKSCIDQSWSPLMDGIVPTQYYSSVSGATQAAIMNALDEHIEKVLYGSKESPLPAFQKICRE